MLADIAHIAGFVATKLHQNPIKYADVVTSTTHKTLRGPRGGIILTNNKEIAQKVDKAVFPGIQGGPQVHSIAAKAVSFEEADSKEFKNYQERVLMNSKEFANYFLKKGKSIITNGTQNHLVLIDTKKSFNITGSEAEKFLEEANIIVNKNSIPFDKLSPRNPSGIRIGTSAMTTLGFDKDSFIEVAKIIYEILENKNAKYSESRKKDVEKLIKSVLEKNEKFKNYWPSSS